MCHPGVRGQAGGPGGAPPAPGAPRRCGSRPSPGRGRARRRSARGPRLGASARRPQELDCSGPRRAELSPRLSPPPPPPPPRLPQIAGKRLRGAPEQPRRDRRRRQREQQLPGGAPTAPGASGPRSEVSSGRPAQPSPAPRAPAPPARPPGLSPHLGAAPGNGAQPPSRWSSHFVPRSHL